MKCSFLLIASEWASPKWVGLLQKILKPFGDLEIQTDIESHQIHSRPSLKGVLIDSGIDEDPVILTSQINICCPEVPIIIFTAAPTSEEYLEAIHAGAKDLLPKDKNERELRDILIEMFNLGLQQ